MKANQRLQDKLYDQAEKHSDRIVALNDKIQDEISSRAEKIFESIDPVTQFEGKWANSLQALEKNLGDQGEIFKGTLSWY